MRRERERSFYAFGSLLRENKKNTALKIAGYGQDRSDGAGKRSGIAFINAVCGDKIFAKLALPRQFGGRNYGSEY